eukprot:TRINITY_DN7361_c0_g1_i1.p1 TRINITY_DN7361_c0_g1~~TRINITY_DN7361_c0_g1_i1.p1  ORF type:complete len:1410 (-),score=322.67 TRINITY_DN7361_c0_g1_i1:41-4132(-)
MTNVFDKQYLLDVKKKKDALVSRLQNLAKELASIEQGPAQHQKIRDIIPVLSSPDFVKHKDRDVKLLVAVGLVDILRIAAPDPPVPDARIKDIFALFGEQLRTLVQPDSDGYARAFHILEMLAVVKSFLIVTESPEDDLMTNLINSLFAALVPAHGHKVQQYVLEIIAGSIEEVEYIPQSVLDSVLMHLVTKSDDNSAQYAMARSVVVRAADKLQPYIGDFLNDHLSGKRSTTSELTDHVYELIFELSQCAPSTLLTVLPNFANELKQDDLDLRCQAVKLLGRIFEEPQSSIAATNNTLWHEYLQRFVDKDTQVRHEMICHAGRIVEHHSALASELLAQLNQRLLDPDDKLRRETVMSICQIATKNLAAVSKDVLESVGARLSDKKFVVRKETLKQLSALYSSCLKNQGETVLDDDEELAAKLAWIPSKVISNYAVPAAPVDEQYLKFQIEKLLDEQLLPTGSVEVRSRALVRLYVRLDSAAKDALLRLWRDKRVYQADVQKFILAHEQKEGVEQAIKILARLPDPTGGEAADHLNQLQELKDKKIFKLLSSLADPTTKYADIAAAKPDIAKRIGSKNTLLNYVQPLMLKLAMTTICKEGIPVIFRTVQDREDDSLSSAALGLLVEVAKQFPSLFTESHDAILALISSEDSSIVEGGLQLLMKTSLALPASAKRTCVSQLRKLASEGDVSQTKLAVRALIALPDTERDVAALAKELKGDLKDSSSRLTPALKAFVQLAGFAKVVFADFADAVLKYVANDVLGSKASKLITAEAKATGVQLLGRFLSSVGSQAEADSANVQIAFKTLASLLKTRGVSDGKSSKQAECETVYLSAVHATLRIARHAQWDNQLSGHVFHDVAAAAFHHADHVRRDVLQKCGKGLASKWLQAKYMTLLAILAADSDAEIKHQAKLFLAHVIRQRRLYLQQRDDLSISSPQGAVLLPEYALLVLVHVLAHSVWDDDDKESSIKEAIRYLSPFLDQTLANVDNFSFIVNIVSDIKLHDDAFREGSRTAIFAIAELVLLLVKHKSVGKHVAQLPAGTRIFLPKRFYVKRQEDDGKREENETKVLLKSYLPEGFSLDKVSGTTPKKSTPSKKLVAESGDEDSDESGPRRKAVVNKSPKRKSAKQLTLTGDVADVPDVKVKKPARKAKKAAIVEDSDDEAPEPMKKPQLTKGGKRKSAQAPVSEGEQEDEVDPSEKRVRAKTARKSAAADEEETDAKSKAAPAQPSKAGRKRKSAAAESAAAPAPPASRKRKSADDTDAGPAKSPKVAVPKKGEAAASTPEAGSADDIKSPVRKRKAPAAAAASKAKRATKEKVAPVKEIVNPVSPKSPAKRTGKAKPSRDDLEMKDTVEELQETHRVTRRR